MNAIFSEETEAAVKPADRVIETGNEEKRTETVPQVSLVTPVAKPSQIPRKVPKHRPTSKNHHFINIITIFSEEDGIDEKQKSDGAYNSSDRKR